MTVRFRSIALSVVSGGLILLAGPLAALGQTPRAERPTYSLGERWIRSDGIFDLIRIENGIYVFAADGGREIHLNKDLLVVRVSRRDAVEWELDPAAKMAWPLEVGKWGIQQLSFPRSYPYSTPLNLTWKVEAYEDVKVPGGIFKAFRISYALTIATYAAAGASVARLTVWYAPIARQLVRGEGIAERVGGPQFPGFVLVAPVEIATTAAGPGPAPGASRPELAAPGGIEVRITSPADNARVDRDGVTLAGVVSADRGIARLIVSLNGGEVSRVEERVPPRSIPLAAPLKLGEGLNTLLVTAVAADGTVRQVLHTIYYERPTPLTITMRYPSDGARVSEESSVVAAVVASGKGVASVTVTLNGAEVHRQQERGEPKSTIVTVPVRLKDGPNTVVVSAAAGDGQTSQELRTLVLERPAGAPTLATVPSAPKSTSLRNSWAVIIGVGRYESAAIPRLTYAVSDAEAIYQTLIGAVGFKKERVLLLTDRSERKPTLRAIRWALGTFLSRSARRDDTVLIFFAGHGAPEVDPRGLEPDGLAKYLVPIDADPDDLYSSALPLDELQTIFARIEAERVIAFLDACYSGAAGGRTFASKKTRAGAVDDLFLDRLTRSRGRAIVSASRPSEVSLELPELGHGLFTYYLLQGLKGAGDLNRDGIVTLQELYEYVEQQVVGKSRAVGGNQHPVMKGELEGTLPLTKVSPRRP
jgi:hypothetical protein